MAARGLCKRCYSVVQDAGELEQWPRVRKQSDQIIENVRWMAENGTPVVEWPRRLEMTPTALERMLYRAGLHRLAGPVSRLRGREYK
jgi:hypothetical protein